MAEQIDSLMVKLGLESDAQQFQQAERQFDSLRSTALQAGAAIGAGFGLNELTFGFAKATDEMRRFSEIYSVAPEFVDQLGFAFERTGGDASDAFESIRNVADLIESTQWGEIPSDAFREFGVDPMMLQGVESVAEAYDRIVGAAQDLDPETARRFFGSMGFSEAELRLARGTGDESFRSLMAEAESRADLTQSMQDNAEAFTRGTAQLQRSLEGVSREISDIFVGDLGKSMTELADWLSENRNEIREFADEAIPYLKVMAGSLGVLVAIQSARSALGILKSVPGLTALVAGAGYGAYLSAQDGDASVTDSPLPSGVQPIGGGLDTSMIGGGPDRAFGGGGNQTNIDLRVDARGSRDPAATEEAVSRGVDRALSRAAENAVIDLSSTTR